MQVALSVFFYLTFCCVWILDTDAETMKKAYNVKPQKVPAFFHKQPQGKSLKGIKNLKCSFSSAQLKQLLTI